MHKLNQTITVSALKANVAAAFAMAEAGPVLVLSGATHRAVLVAPAEWNRVARRLRMLEALCEAQRIEARNDADGSWVSGAELRARLPKRGIG